MAFGARSSLDPVGLRKHGSRMPAELRAGLSLRGRIYIPRCRPRSNAISDCEPSNLLTGGQEVVFAPSKTCDDVLAPVHEFLVQCVDCFAPGTRSILERERRAQ